MSETAFYPEFIKDNGPVTSENKLGLKHNTWIEALKTAGRTALVFTALGVGGDALARGHDFVAREPSPEEQREHNDKRTIALFEGLGALALFKLRKELAK